MQKKIRVGLIGAGMWGQNHLRTLHKLGVLVMVADTNSERLEKIKNEFSGVTVTESYKELISSSEVDAVVIATPAFTHAAIARDALEAGKHTFVEKPLALNHQDGEMLCNKAKTAERILMVGHLLHYHPAIIELKKSIARGELGAVKHIASHRLNFGTIRTEENVIWSLAPHDISLMLNFFNAEPTHVQVTKNQYAQKKIADIAHVELQFEGNKNAHIYASWLHPYKERKFIVIGEKAMAVFDDLAENKLVIYDSSVEWEGSIPHAVSKGVRAIPLAGEHTVRARTSEESGFAGSQRRELTNKEPLMNELEHFISCIQTGATPLTDGEEGLRVLRVLESCQ